MTEDTSCKPVEAIEEEALEVPELAFGILIGLKPDGHFFMKELTSPSEYPVADKMVLRQLLELAYETLTFMLHDKFGMAHPGVLSILQSQKMIAQAFSGLAQKVQAQLEPLPSMMTQVQHTQGEVLQVANTLHTQPRKAKSSSKK